MPQLFYDPKLLDPIMHIGDDNEAFVATLHNGIYHLDENGFVDDTEVIPEIARVELEKLTGTIQFDDLPECDANHVAVWTSNGQLLLRAYCFPVEDLPEWTQTRHIPAGGSVEVNIA